MQRFVQKMGDSWDQTACIAWARDSMHVGLVYTQVSACREVCKGSFVE